MSLNTVTLKWDLTDFIESGQAASITLEPTALLTDPADHIVVGQIARSVAFTGGTGQLAGIIGCDDAQISPAGWAYLITVTTAAGQVVYSNTAFINYASGAVQYLDGLPVAENPVTYQAYLPLPAGTPAANEVPVATGSGQASAWGTPPGGTPSGAAGGVLSGTYPNPGLAASPALAGTPTAPTAAPLTNSTQVATTAYADAGVAAETSRAETAEGLKAALTGAAFTGAVSSTSYMQAKLSGASANSRYVGANASGHPTGSGNPFSTGDFAIDQSGGIWICTASGSPGTWAAVGASVASGRYLTPPSIYAPASQANLTATGTSLSAFDSGVVCTGSFTAPASGEVVVGVSCVASLATAVGCAFGLCATGTTTPAVADLVLYTDSTGPVLRPVVMNFIVTGLTTGNSYNFDLMGAIASGTLTVAAIGQSGASPNFAAGSRGGPVVMTVQAI